MAVYAYSPAPPVLSKRSRSLPRVWIDNGDGTGYYYQVTEDDLPYDNWYKLVQDSRPDIDARTQVAHRVTTVDGGTITYSWNVLDKSQEDLDAEAAAAAEAEKQDEADAALEEERLAAEAFAESERQFARDSLQMISDFLAKRTTTASDRTDVLTVVTRIVAQLVKDQYES